MKDQRVDIKIKSEYRDILKEYCKWSGDKMYVVIQRLIKKHCQIPNSNNTLPSKYVDTK